MTVPATIAERYPDALTMDGYDDCIIGMAHRAANESVVAYDQSMVIDRLVAEGMSTDEALEFHEFNQLGAWMGVNTPLFVERTK